MVSVTKPKLAVVGVGLAGKRHIDVILNNADVVLSAVIDPDIKTQEIAKEAGCLWFPSLQEMFSSDKLNSHQPDGVIPDGVIIATPNNYHVEHGLECIKHQCPILIEKPIATTVKDAEILIDAARKNNVAIAVGHHRRHASCVQKAHQIIGAGALGDIRAVQGQCWFYKPDDYFEIAPWRKQKGAGPISVNLIHDIDILRYLCGNVVSVFADAVQAKRGYENEDVATILLRFENDALCTLSVSDAIAAPWSWELTAHENPVYPETDQSCYMIGGTDKSLSLPDVTLWEYRGKKSWWEDITPNHMTSDANDPFMAQMEQFIKVIAKQEQPLVSGEDGLKALQVIEAIYQSVQSKASIAL